MRALVARGPGSLALERIPIPEPGAGEVRIRVLACGLCGSDLHLHHLGIYKPGITPGHEIAGVVDAATPGVENVAVGDAVAVEPLRGCGRCRMCRQGRVSICPEVEIYGVGCNGGFAEYVTVPAIRAFRLPGGLPAPVAALAEPAAVVIHGLRMGGFEPDQRLLILGAGALGLMAIVAARSLRAKEIWISARHPHQAELARELGATRILGEHEAQPAALGALPPFEKPELILETVGGTANTLSAAVDAVAPGGTVSVLGLFTQPLELGPLPLFIKEVKLVWSNCYQHGDERADFDDALALLDDYREELARFTTHTMPLDDAERAYATAAEKKSGVVKVTLVP